MNRVLVSQNENNKETDYLIVNGILLTDKDSIVNYGRIISETDSWPQIHNDAYLEIRRNENQLLFKSFYDDKDMVGRAIYYLYLIEDKLENIDNILMNLEQDSQLISRTFDRDRTQDIVTAIKNSKETERKIIKYVAITAGALVLLYLLTKIKI